MELANFGDSCFLHIVEAKRRLNMKISKALAAAVVAAIYLPAVFAQGDEPATPVHEAAALEPAAPTTQPEPQASKAIASAEMEHPSPEPVAAPATPAPRPTRYPFGVKEVLELHQSGVEGDVILSYIRNSGIPYYLSADQIIRLHRDGLPSAFITAMIQQGAATQEIKVAAQAKSPPKTEVSTEPIFVTPSRNTTETAATTTVTEVIREYVPIGGSTCLSPKSYPYAYRVPRGYSHYYGPRKHYRSVPYYNYQGPYPSTWR